jgi:hypothetical protein
MHPRVWIETPPYSGGEQPCVSSALQRNRRQKEIGLGSVSDEKKGANGI